MKVKDMKIILNGGGRNINCIRYQNKILWKRRVDYDWFEDIGIKKEFETKSAQILTFNEKPVENFFFNVVFISDKLEDMDKESKSKNPYILYDLDKLELNDNENLLFLTGIWKNISLEGIKGIKIKFNRKVSFSEIFLFHFSESNNNNKIETLDLSQSGEFYIVSLEEEDDIKITSLENLIITKEIIYSKKTLGDKTLDEFKSMFKNSPNAKFIEV